MECQKPDSVCPSDTGSLSSSRWRGTGQNSESGSDFQDDLPHDAANPPNDRVVQVARQTRRYGTVRLRGAASALKSAPATVAAAVLAPAYREEIGEVMIVHPWSLPAQQGRNGVIYFEVHNAGAVEDRLIEVSTLLAERGELHRGTMEGGIHRMEKVKSIAVPAGGSVELASGGLHVMLIGLKAHADGARDHSGHLHFRALGRDHDRGCGRTAKQRC